MHNTTSQPQTINKHNLLILKALNFEVCDLTSLEVSTKSSKKKVNDRWYCHTNTVRQYKRAIATIQGDDGGQLASLNPLEA
jgi:hypothetical protein